MVGVGLSVSETWPGGPGRLPSRGSHRSGRAQFALRLLGLRLRCAAIDAVDDARAVGSRAGAVVREVVALSVSRVSPFVPV